MASDIRLVGDSVIVDGRLAPGTNVAQRPVHPEGASRDLLTAAKGSDMHEHCFVRPSCPPG